ncbi:uncharacterized protein LOC134233087 [Saccostrea cucullata]|uniref:uncharacterized protein LOC134233087 n=1 Tax=Saccostrea cuccullata TaxID=36930 RepID=UPI002ED04232
MDHNCSRRCRYPGFGKHCQGNCLCNTEYCYFRMGCANSIENSTHYNGKNISSRPGTFFKSTNKITLVAIIASAFLLFLILTKILLIRRKTKHTAAQADYSATLEENDLYNAVDEFPTGVGSQNCAVEDVNPTNKDLRKMDYKNPTGLERNIEKKKIEILKKKSEVTNIREAENVYTLTFASFGSEMMRNSVHDYSPLQYS